MNNDLIRTVAYFTSVGQSVTANDIWQWMHTPVRSWSLREVINELQNVQDSLCMRDGRFVIRGHEAIFDNEHVMYLDSDRKYKNAQRYAKWIRRIPGVRAVSICNTLAWESTTSSSDTDFLVIARSGTLWFTRFLAVVPLMLLKMRPGERKIDPVDFTFFISDNALNLSSLQIKNSDPYLAYWTASLVPIIDDGIMEEFWKANQWVKDILPNTTHRWLAMFRRPQATMRKNTHSSPPWWLRVQDYFETMAKKLSLKRFPESIKSQMNKSSNVIVSDNMLKFHVDDDRIQIRDNWKRLYEQFS